MTSMTVRIGRVLKMCSACRLGPISPHLLNFATLVSQQVCSAQSETIIGVGRRRIGIEINMSALIYVLTRLAVGRIVLKHEFTQLFI